MDTRKTHECWMCGHSVRAEVRKLPQLSERFRCTDLVACGMRSIAAAAPKTRAAGDRAAIDAAIVRAMPTSVILAYRDSARDVMDLVSQRWMERQRSGEELPPLDPYERNSAAEETVRRFDAEIDRRIPVPR